jgi:TPR repeat protein
VGQDAARAAGWFERAAQQGHAQAQFNWAQHLAGGGGGQGGGEGGGEGGGGAPLEAEAAAAAAALQLRRAAVWYRKAAEQGHVRAQSMLGSAYYFGEGVEESKQQAVAWYVVACCLGVK